MKFSAAVILAAAIGASAYPGHHSHRHAHRSAVQGREFVMAKKPAPPAPTTTSTPPPPATSTATPTPSSAPPPVANAAVAVDTSSSSSSAKASSSPAAGGFKPFCSGKGKRATLAQIAYAGNVGTKENYGCNIQEISANSVSSYDYTMTFNNKLGSAQDCTCWNKIAADGTISGFFLQNVAMKFSLPANGKAYVAVDGNSQIGCACGPGSIPTTSFGQVASTWLECDFGNESNQKWSGCDASALVSGKYGLNIPPLSVCNEGDCSTIYQGGTGDNAYVPGTEDVDGLGFKVPAGKVKVDVHVG
ncbi:hypothetical protein PWT90_05405 [Aphanocladium album]|nr:hypothetical protein PWT90_05405 [Aphanocladium album]